MHSLCTSGEEQTRAGQNWRRRTTTDAAAAAAGATFSQSLSRAQILPFSGFPRPSRCPTMEKCRCAWTMVGKYRVDQKLCHMFDGHFLFTIPFNKLFNARYTCKKKTLRPMKSFVVMK